MEAYLRKALERELDTVREIYADARGYEGCVWGEDYPDEELLREDFTSGNLYTYVLKNEIIGVVSLENSEEFDNFKCWKIQDGREVCFSRVAISKKYHSKGYGKKMIAALLLLLKEKGYSSARILVSPSNPAAMAVYRGLGFDFYEKVEMYGREFLLSERIIR